MEKRRSSDPGVESERLSFFAEEEGYAAKLSEKMNGLGMSSAVAGFAAVFSSTQTSLSTRSSCTSSSSGSRAPTGKACPSDAPAPHGFPSTACVRHPALCRLPCQDLASCLASCRRKKMQHMDRKSRQIFGAMGRQAQVEVLRRTLAAKVAELGLGAEAARAVEAWHAEVAVAPPVQESSALTPAEAQRLRQCLEGLHLNDLCGVPAPCDVRRGL
ncbi:unnamed protein product, partial [Prorocentrum cordatum]